MEQTDYRLAAIMYTDIAGFSRMMERDEAGTLELLRYHNALFGEIVEAHHGKIIKTIGDALLVDFKNTVEALQSALEAQDKLYAHNKENPDLPLLVRIGIHLGDIYFFENDALGEGINIAARLQSLASPGCICFSQDVYNLVLNKIEFRAEKLGKVSLKNITKEIHAYEITTPNAEFDPNRGKPKPGYKPGSYLEGGEGKDEADVTEDDKLALSHAPLTPRPQNAEKPAHQPSPTSSPQSPAVSRPPVEATAHPGPEPIAVPPSPAPQAEPAGADRSYTADGSARLLDEIKKAILQDIKTEGRRLTVQEALTRYGSFGVEAKEVIASMADSGLLVRDSRGGISRERDFRDEAQGGTPYGESAARQGQEGFDAEAFGRNMHAVGKSIEVAVRGIVDEIEKNVEAKGESGKYEYNYSYNRDLERHRDRHARRAERRAIKAALIQDELELPTGKWDKGLRENATWKPGEEETSSDMDAYRDRLATRARHQRGGLIGNFASYLAVNAGLFYIYTTFAPHALWAFIVAAAWGIGLVSNFVAAVRGGAKVREAEAMPDLEGKELEAYKKLNRVRDSLAMHTASTVTVPILLGIVNFCYPGGSHFLWFLFPTVAMLISWLSHMGSYGPSKSRLQKAILSGLGVEGGWRNIFKDRKARAASLGAYAALYEEAARAKDAILSEIRADAAGNADLEPSLDAYVGQVKLLAQSANEIEKIVGAIPMADLAKDKAELAAKSASAASAGLKEEYQRSIMEIEKQEKSYAELRDQSEVIKLRLSSSVNQLKQMRIDMARLRAAGDDGSGGLDELKKRTSELSLYLQDLHSGYSAEAAEDPYAELEKKLAREEADKKRLE